MFGQFYQYYEYNSRLYGTFYFQNAADGFAFGE